MGLPEMPEIPGLATVANGWNWVSTGAANVRDGTITRLATARVFTAQHSNYARLATYSFVAFSSWYITGDGSLLTYLAPTAVAATAAFWHRHTIEQVTTEQLVNAQPHLNSASKYVESHSGQMSAAAYVTATAASWYFWNARIS